MPHSEMVKPAFSQVGALSVGFGLSVFIQHSVAEKRGLKQTSPIRPNASSLIIDVDYVFPGLRTPQTSRILYGIFLALSRKPAGKNAGFYKNP